ncbi:MAG TPA: ABC transporter permease [Candidatus Nanoarchaeia archaeon]|nr:ABC transporter permease [Candidatus Nanoarchaeia archaeon]
MFTRQELSLLKELTLREFKLRYQNSVLGFFWSLLKPFALFLTFYVVLQYFLKINVPDYAFFLLIGILLWNFFSESTTAGLHGLVSKGSIIKKTYFKYELCIISACLTAFISFLLNFFVFLVLLVILKGVPGLSLFYLPLPFLEIFFISLGLSFFLAPLFTQYRDISHVWEILLQIGFWVTPIAYPLDFVPKQYLSYYLLNPLANIVVHVRESILQAQIPSFFSGFASFILAIAISLLGYLFYNIKKKSIAERL